MKTWLYSFLLAFTFSIWTSQAVAWDCCNWDCCNWSCGDLAVEGRVAYFRPSSKKVQEIYGDGWADYQIEISKGFGENWRAWLGVSGFEKSGHSLGFHDKTKLSLIPVTLGAKYLFCLDACTKLYVGAGICYSSLSIKDHSNYVHEHISKGRVGGLFQVGVYYVFTEHFFADIFVDYLYQRFDFSKSHDYSQYVERHDLNLSGFKVGGGIGIKF
jgi:hypothetical protein